MSKKERDNQVTYTGIVTTLLGVITLIGLLAGGVFYLINKELAVPKQKIQQTSSQLREVASIQNRLVNFDSLSSAGLEALNEKVKGNTEFIKDYLFVKKTDIKLELLRKDVDQNRKDIDVLHK